LSDMDLSSSVLSIPGVGSRRGKSFEKLGVRTVEDLLFFFPRAYLDRRDIRKISQAEIGETMALRGRIVAVEAQRRRKPYYVKCAFTDGTGTLFILFFNQLYLMNMLLPETKIFLFGKVEEYRRTLQMCNPVFDLIEPSKQLDYILPVYPLVAGLSQNFIRNTIRGAIKSLASFPKDLLPFDERMELSLSYMKFALSMIHFPKDEVNLERARRHLVFDEFFRMQMRLLEKKGRLRRKSEEVLKVFTEYKADISIAAFEEKLPFSLTAGQKKIMRNLVEQVQQGNVIDLLLQGEVGSGKTVLAIFFIHLFLVAGYQAVFLAPTEILAQQHYLNWHSFFQNEGYHPSLLIGSLTKQMKSKEKEKIFSGEARVVFGTHAILNETIVWKNLKAVVTDEQHKFGVAQRTILKRAGKEVHHLSMSATPIPRSVALTLFGNRDILLLGEFPHGARNVVTLLFSLREKEKALFFIEARLSEGDRGYVVVPAIEESEKLASIEEEKKMFSLRFARYGVGILHGKCSSAEKSDMIQKFREGKIQLLLSTTVIEVGMDVPEAHFILIVQAEQYGLSQLHQLRGRVGRSGKQGYCMLLAHTGESSAIERLTAFLGEDEGQKLAELDLLLRGPGDLFGVRQHGILPLKIADIVKDVELLELARKKARLLMEDRKIFSDPRYSAIKQFLDLHKETQIAD
jgi:ATP-dependent DNA helicase RecG